MDRLVALDEFVHRHGRDDRPRSSSGIASSDLNRTHDFPMSSRFPAALKTSCTRFEMTGSM
jgi:hypothetical protein